MYLEITTNDDRLETDTETDTEKITTHNHVTCSPDEAEDELVYFEKPGTVGKEVYRIKSVNADTKSTTLENLSTGSETVISDDIPFPPDWNRFTVPHPGTRITVYWKEHLNGAGDWVRTTPKRTRNRVERYYGRYTGHEKTRCIEQTIVYTPPGITEHEIKSAEGDGVEVYFNPTEGDITGLDRVFDQIETVPATYTTIGHVYLNENHDIAWFNIDPEYTGQRLESPYTIIEEINEQKEQTGEETESTQSDNELIDAINSLRQNEDANDEQNDEIDRELEQIADNLSDERKAEIDRELEQIAENLSDERKAEIDRELETLNSESDENTE